MTTISATEAKQNFAALLDRSQSGPVVIQRHERDIAVLISAEEYEKIRQLRVAELLRVSDKMAMYAESQGMTDEVFAELMSEK